MFFIMGISDSSRELDFSQLMTCDVCGRYGRFQVFMTFTVLSLFFIPTFRWNRRYYVRTSCCGTVYELDPEIGRMIERGGNPEIRPEHLTRTGPAGAGGIAQGYKKCRQCGYETTEDFEYCPKCGTRF